jgi:signal transduction histidine kinase
VEDRLFAALAVLRIVVLVNAVAIAIYQHTDFPHPAAFTTCMVVMALWTAWSTWAYRGPRLRTPLLLGVDLALATALVLVSPLVKGDDFRATVPGSWIVAALVSWSIHYRLRGGIAAGILLAAADLSERQELRQTDYNNAFLLILAGSIVGYLCGSLQDMATEREQAQQAATAAGERARLARAVHDGVLQVLALVQRRGRELGGEAAELGALAGEQERVLRRLVQARDTTITTHGTTDVTADLAALENIAGVTVSTPGFPVELPVPTAREVVALVRSCLDNVKTHVGEDAPAWVLLQAYPDRIELSVRDAGPGILPGRIEQAAREGRLGVSTSIRGRVADLGGTAQLSTAQHGTEWEFVIPRVPGAGPP